MAFHETYVESIQTKHLSNVGFTSTAKGVTNESFSVKNPHQLLASQIPSIDVVTTHGIYTASGIAAGVVEEHIVELTADPTVNGNKAWLAYEADCIVHSGSGRGDTRIDQWMRYPQTEYKLRLYSATSSGTPDYSNEILPSETQFNWEYDPSAGAVYFDEDPTDNTGFTGRLWGTVYTYIGETVADGLTSVSGSSHVQNTDQYLDFGGSNEVSAPELHADLPLPGITVSPHGFPDRFGTTLAFDDANRQFSITPTGASFDYYDLAVKYTVATSGTVQITDTDGLWYIYYEGSTLTASQTEWAYSSNVPVADVYWDATNKTAVVIADERHGVVMDPGTYEWIHKTVGARYQSGLALSYTAGDGSANTHAQISLENGIVWDGDLDYEIIDGSPQDISPVTQAPVFYRTGATGSWRKTVPDTYPVYDSVGTGRLGFNEWTGATWQMSEVSDNGFIAMWIIATNDINYPIIACTGQRDDTSLLNAQNNNTWEGLSFGCLPFREMKVLYRVIYRTKNTFSNAVLALIEDVQDLRSVSNFPSGTYVATDHGTLTGLADQDHPAAAIYTTTTSFSGTLSSADDDVQKSLETIDTHTHDGRYYTETEVDGLVSGLDSDITTLSGFVADNYYDATELDAGQLDNRYYTETEVNTISGALSNEIDADVTTLSGFVADNYYDATELDAGQLDNRYYTETELDAGQLDNRYYTETEVNTISGALSDEIDSDVTTLSGFVDDNYYDKTELDAGQLDNRYYTETELDAGQLDNRYYTETEVNTISGALSDEIDSDITAHHAPTSADHDDRYYTETEVDNMLAAQDEFLELTDTISTYTDGRMLVETSTELVDYSGLTYASGTNTFTAPNVDVTTNLDVGGDTDLTGTLGFDAGVTINEFVVTLSGAPTNDQVATALGTKNYVDDQIDDNVYWELIGDVITNKSDYQNVNILNNLVVQGDLLVSGTRFITSTETVEISDNLLIINNGEVGAGVTEGVAGFEVDRGTLDNYMFYFDETDDNFQIGVSGSLQAVATREDTPTDNYVAVWNEFETRFDTEIDINALATDAEVLTVSGVLSAEIDSDIATHHLPTSADHDDRYYTETEVNGFVTDLETDITTLSGFVADNYYDKTELDAGQLDNRYYTETELDAGQLDNRYYTETEVNTISGALSDEIDSDITTLSGFVADNYYDSTELDAGQLDNRYYTETELDAGQLDNRYYTETEVNTISGALSDEIDADVTTLSGFVADNYYDAAELDAGQLDNRYYTETEVDGLISSIDSDITTLSGFVGDNYYDKTELDAGQLDNRYYTETEVDTISGSLQTNIDEAYADAIDYADYRSTGSFLCEDLLIYYGYTNSFNYAVHGWSNEKVARDMAQYNMVVFGAGVADTGHADYANFLIVAARLKVLKPTIKLFGYATMNQSLANFQADADEWNAVTQVSGIDIDGILMDECGYDYSVTRSGLNDGIDYVHSLSCNVCFVNAWFMDHIVGVVNDPIYPNSTFNPGLVASNLTDEDWYLLESYPCNTGSFSGNNGYCTMVDWLARGNNATSNREEFGVKLASVSVISNTDPTATTLYDFHYHTALTFALDAQGSSDTLYGATSARVDIHERTSWLLEEMGLTYEASPSVTVDPTNWQLHCRCTNKGQIDCDHTGTDPIITFSNNIKDIESSTSFLELTDTISSYNDGRMLVETGDALVDYAGLTYASGTSVFTAPNVVVTTDLTVSGDSTLSGTLGFDTGTTINEFITTLSGSPTDDQVTTALGTKNYVDDLVSDTVDTVNSLGIFKNVSDGVDTTVASGTDDTLVFIGANGVGITIGEDPNTVTISGAPQTSLVDTMLDWNAGGGNEYWTYGSGFTSVPSDMVVYYNGVKQRDHVDYYVASIDSGAVKVVFAFETFSSDWVNIEYSLTTNTEGLARQWIIKLAAYTAIEGDRIMLDTSAGGSNGAYTITLPANPVYGNHICFLDAGGNCTNNNVTVARNGENIQGAASDLSIDSNDASLELIYYNATRGWVIYE